MTEQLCQTNETSELQRSKEQVWEELINSAENILRLHYKSV